MRKILEIAVENIVPSPEAVMSCQGVPTGTQVNKKTSELARKALSRFKDLARPASLFDEVSADDFQHVYLGSGQNAPATPLDDIIPSARSFALFAVTLGHAICKEISELFEADDYALGAMLDAAASEAAELLAVETERCYRDYLIKSGRLHDGEGVMQFSPGYCGWHISAQKQLFDKLNPGEIGIRLNESFLMDPLKSISGVLISGSRDIFEFDDNFEFCAECRTRSCIERANALGKQ